MPGLREKQDFIVDNKKRYDCFTETDLDFLLRRHGINTLLITGINTSSCVLATAIRANVLDYAPIVIEDCVDTMDGPALHEAALACLRAAFGWTMRSDVVLNTIGLSSVAPTERLGRPHTNVDGFLVCRVALAYVPIKDLFAGHENNAVFLSNRIQ